MLVAAFGGGNCRGPIDVATAQTAHGVRMDFDTETFVTHSLRGEGFDASEDGTGRGTPLVPVAYPLQEVGKRTGASTDDVRAGIGIGGAADPMFTLQAGAQHGVVTPAAAFSIMPMNSGKDYKARETDVAQPLMAGGPVGGNQGGDFVVSVNENQQGAVWEGETAQALNKGGGKPGQGYAAIRTGSAVRRLTPRECERLQGFPDDYTLIPVRGKPAADGPRYKALGNSMAVPVMRWIGERIAAVDAIAAEARAA
jgi:DNA (cytosine-5)-methyltransferase 1